MNKVSVNEQNLLDLQNIQNLAPNFRNLLFLIMLRIYK